MFSYLKENLHFLLGLAGFELGLLKALPAMGIVWDC